MKKLLSFVLVWLLLLGCVPICFAVDSGTSKIVDNADLLTPDQENFLTQKANALIDEYDIDVVIVTVDTLGYKTSEQYADDFYDNNGYGIGDDYSGVLLLLSMEYRDWAISTCGEGIYALTDYGIQTLFGSVSGYLSEDAWFEAFDAYLDNLNGYFDAYRSGSPIDKDDLPDYIGPGTYNPGTQDGIIHYPSEPTFTDYLVRILGALVIGAAVGGIAIFLMRRSMNTARPQSGAKNYMVSGTYHLKTRRDMFLYSRTSRVRRAENNSSGGGHRGGGSSIHRSSSGRSHGGGHGKF